MAFISDIPSTTLADSCYYAMFSGAHIDEYPSILPASNLTPYCYAHMFSNCSTPSYTKEKHIVLPAQSLSRGCYYYMFTGLEPGSVNWTPIQIHLLATTEEILAKKWEAFQVSNYCWLDNTKAVVYLETNDNELFDEDKLKNLYYNAISSYSNPNVRNDVLLIVRHAAGEWRIGTLHGQDGYLVDDLYHWHDWQTSDKN